MGLFCCTSLLPHGKPFSLTVVSIKINYGQKQFSRMELSVCPYLNDLYVFYIKSYLLKWSSTKQSRKESFLYDAQCAQSKKKKGWNWPSCDSLDVYWSIPMTEKEVKFCDLSSALHAVGYQSCEINCFQFKSQKILKALFVNQWWFLRLHWKFVVLDQFDCKARKAETGR